MPNLNSSKAMSIKLMCAGDLMTGENVHHYHRGIVTRFKGRYTNLISESVRELIDASDLFLLNFEASLVPDEEISLLSIDRGVYVTPVESLDLLKSLKSQVIANVANNHFGQHGSESAKFTIGQLEANGINVIGKDNQPLIIQKDGYKVCFWGCSLVKDTKYSGAYFKSDYKDLINELNLAEKGMDEIRVISLHWGEEYLTLPSEAQNQLAVDLEKAGFDFIIGHHPHVIQPIATNKNSIVCYSHGNFIFDQNFSELTRKGLVSLFSLPDRGIKLYLSQQKKYRVISLSQIDESDLDKFCKDHYNKRGPLLMRIRMKLELIFRFYELNGSIIRTFTSRLFKA